MRVSLVCTFPKFLYIIFILFSYFAVVVLVRFFALFYIHFRVVEIQIHHDFISRRETMSFVYYVVFHFIFSLSFQFFRLLHREDKKTTNKSNNKNTKKIKYRTHNITRKAKMNGPLIWISLLLLLL